MVLRGMRGMFAPKTCRMRGPKYLGAFALNGRPNSLRGRQPPIPRLIPLIDPNDHH